MITDDSIKHVAVIDKLKSEDHCAIQFKKLTDSAKIPTRGSAEAAGLDLYADIDTNQVIHSGETVMIGTGVAMMIPNYYAGFIYARSGLASKRGIRPANCVGVVDSDYRGEIKVALHNDSNRAQLIQPGDRIAQMVIMPVAIMPVIETKELPDTERGAGGFGSTGD